MSKKELDKNLRYFYAEARTRDGALYSRSSLLGLRNAIERYLNNPPFNRGISINKGTEFQSSNKLLQSMIKSNKRENNENTKHKPPIPAADIQKLKSSNTIATAITLWSDAQVPSRHIMAISGHRSEASLKSYNTRSSSEKLRACSDVLSGAMSGGPRQPNSPNAVTSSGNPLAAVNSTVVHSQKNKAQQFVKYQPQALSSFFSNCQVNNIQVFMGHDSAGFHRACY